MNVLFVCLGNICRSPTAEAVLRQMATEHKVGCQVKSAGTHAGSKSAPDPRSIKAAFGYSFKGQWSKPLTEQDFVSHDLILAMDLENLATLQRRCPSEHQHKIKLLMQYHPEFPKQQEIPDPYYGGPQGFTYVFQLIETCCQHLLQSIKAQAC